MQWVNYHAFLARLQSTGIWGPSATYMVWAMRDVFEKAPEEAWEKEYHVMAAAQWILYNGQAFFENAFCLGIICDVNDTALAFGGLYKGSGDTLCLGRWRF